MTYGLFVPESYIREVPSDDDMNTGSIFFGFTLAAAIACSVKAGNQTLKSYKRTQRITSYMIMIWCEIIASVVIAVISWCFQRQFINPSFYFFFLIVFFWSLQIQLLLQIICNRVSLLMVSKTKSRRLKWSIFSVILVINISVFCIWVPARLQINETYIHINEVWDRVEKGIFCVLDACLNLYFIHLVRSRLIANGLTKYTRLFKMNLVMISISICLDVILIGTMSLKSAFVYLLFHPVAYLIKLQIEMTMADLIGKVVKASQGGSGPYKSDKSRSALGDTSKKSRLTGVHTGVFEGQHSTHVGIGSGADVELVGIQKVTETHVVIDPKEDDQDDGRSRSSSTRQLRDFYGV
ncbi:hypothetical protein F4778DRAFT_798168 [Xylariomycetidae sp. FL2044]|nr:hypothetical protein F4778DRAFT_788699 [Xylariomycetidae sp. FL2044]KAH9908166.1 hypothetical protein F4778DRAFT_798168 [Xylariomycetidae sp. FL2044]